MNKKIIFVVYGRDEQIYELFKGFVQKYSEGPRSFP